jgi:hypothetical protein
MEQGKFLGHEMPMGGGTTDRKRYLKIGLAMDE